MRTSCNNFCFGPTFVPPEISEAHAWMGSSFQAPNWHPAYYILRHKIMFFEPIAVSFSGEIKIKCHVLLLPGIQPLTPLIWVEQYVVAKTRWLLTISYMSYHEWVWYQRWPLCYQWPEGHFFSQPEKRNDITLSQRAVRCRMTYAMDPNGRTVS